MARKRENPASGPGLKKNTNCACREDNTPIRLEAQGFSSCVPCANCPHFRLVRFNSRKKRHQCSYSGLWLESCGVIECPVRREGVDLRKILPFACSSCPHAQRETPRHISRWQARRSVFGQGPLPKAQPTFPTGCTRQGRKPRASPSGSTPWRVPWGLR